MRRVDRASVPVPKSLLPGGAGPKELEKARAHGALPKPKKAFPFGAYKGADVKFALELLFHGKCAYCETRYSATAPVDVEHYRPKNAVAEDSSHDGYWWIAMDWDNLLPSCIDCNRRRGQVIVGASSSLEALANTSKPATTASGKKDCFPLAEEGERALAEIRDFAEERALLINPCNDDPATCITYSFDPARPIGLMLPEGDLPAQTRGAVSIQVYGLNRLGLVQERTAILRRLEFLGTLVLDLAECVADLEEPATRAKLQGTSAMNAGSRLKLLRDRTLAEMKSMAAVEAPYSSMVAAWLRGFARRIAPPS